MRKFLLPTLFATLALVGAGCTDLFGGSPQVDMTPVTLKYWRVGDDAAAFSEIISNYQKLHPHVTVEYRAFTEDEYHRALREAFAEDRGPDIFSLSNVDLVGWLGKIQPMPKEVTMPTVTVDANQRIVTQNVTNPTITLRELRNEYVEAVVADVVKKGPGYKPEDPKMDRIYGLPLSLDTLGVYYNRDILKRADIAAPASTWSEFSAQVASLTRLSGDGKGVEQSAAGIGLYANVRHADDILLNVMLQNGARLSVDGGGAAFAQYNPNLPQTTAQVPGVEAVMFLTGFAMPGSAYYTWDAAQSDSLDAFVSGKTAYYFGYPSDAALIRERAPRLDFGVSALPLVDKTRVARVAHYPVEVVARKVSSTNAAWDFLQFAAEADQAKSFLTVTKRPTALRSLINAQLEDPEVAPFAGQVLTAMPWYFGTDYEKAKEGFKYIYETKPTVERPEWDAIVRTGEGMVNQSMR